MLVPSTIFTTYLYDVALDQYHSDAAFSIRSDESIGVPSLQSAFTQTVSSSKVEAEIIRDFIRSQALIERIEARTDLRAIFEVPGRDIVFTMQPGSSIEDRTWYWNRMVSVSVAPISGLVHLRVKAFTPEQAQSLAGLILSESGNIVDTLSESAEESYISASKKRRIETEAQLRDARAEVQKFRSENNIIDPESDFSIRNGVVAALQNELAQLLIERSVVDGFSKNGSSRVDAIDSKIEAIRSQIEIEREDVLRREGGDRTLSGTLNEFESLLVELEIAEQSYKAALMQEEEARGAAQRQKRFVTVHIPPTLSEESQYPDRIFLSIGVFFCLFAIWSVLVLIYYNVEDRS